MLLGMLAKMDYRHSIPLQIFALIGLFGILAIVAFGCSFFKLKDCLFGPPPLGKK
jgi:hypothetical protein